MSGISLSYGMINWKAGEITVLLSDGTKLSKSLQGGVLSQQIETTIFDHDKWWVWNFTSQGDTVASEMYSPVSRDPTKGRPVVYLDQNHWSTLAFTLLEPSRVRKKSEIEPATRIIQLARDGGIILPLSNAHLLETYALHGARRYQVGINMAQLTGGWQMRHPLKVRRAEIASSLVAELRPTSGPALKIHPVITLEPFAALDDGTNAAEMDPNDPELYRLAHLSSSVMLATLLDPEGLKKVPATGWAESQQAFTDHLATRSGPKPLKGSASYAWTFLDIFGDVVKRLVAMGANPATLEGIKPRTFLQRTPMLRLYSEVARFRHVDRAARWEPNDLVDMMFLTCAAGYADYVAGEKKTAKHIAQAQRAAGITVNTYPTLEELIDALARDGVRTVTERARDRVTLALPDATGEGGGCVR